MGAKSDQEKAKWYPAIGAAVITAIVLAGSSLLLEQKSNLPATQSTLPTPAPQTSPVEQPPAIEQPIASKLDPVAIANRQGTLRISNPTDYPVRVALLAKTPTPPKSNYDIPAHWDFAPQEGSGRGLIVSLPDRSIRLKQGDILVAFAQDGSRRYWGPYVVGETEAPVWNPKAGEWQLTLQP